MFVAGVILLIIGIGGLLASRTKGGKTVALAGFPLALICLITASISTVPTRNVGIVTSWSKPTGRTTGAGLQWTAPWQNVDDWDASGQTYAHLGDSCVWVAIAAQRRACIPVQIEWAAKAERAPENWAAYREADGNSRFETFVIRRVEPQILASLISVFASFDPLKAVDPKSGDAAAPDLNSSYRETLTTALTGTLGEDISIRSIAFGAPQYDEPTTKAIDAYGQKILEARNLQIDKANAVTRAEITRTDASVDQVARCLQIAEKLGKEPGLCMTPTIATRPIGDK